MHVAIELTGSGISDNQRKQVVNELQRVLAAINNSKGAADYPGDFDSLRGAVWSRNVAMNMLMQINPQWAAGQSGL